MKETVSVQWEIPEKWFCTFELIYKVFQNKCEKL